MVRVQKCRLYIFGMVEISSRGKISGGGCGLLPVVVQSHSQESAEEEMNHFALGGMRYPSRAVSRLVQVRDNICEMWEEWQASQRQKVEACLGGSVGSA